MLERLQTRDWSKDIARLRKTTNVAQYFTLWCLLLVCFSSHTHMYVDLLLTSSFVLLCGSYLTYVYPRRVKFMFNGETFTIVGWKLNLIDLLFHVLPFMYIVWRYGEYYIKSEKTIPPLLNSLLVALLYVSTFDVFEVYGVRKEDVVNALFITCFVGIVYVALIWHDYANSMRST